MTDITHTNGTENNQETSPSDAEGNPVCVIWLWRANIPRDLGIMQTFAALARKGDISIAKNVVDELVHRRLLKLTPCTRLAAEGGRTLDFLS